MTTPLTQSLLAAIRQRLPVVEHILKVYGRHSVTDYLAAGVMRHRRGYQPHEELGDALYEEAAPLLGERAASRARAELRQSPVVLTANHHGVDSFAQSVQGTLLFSQRAITPGQQAATVPVLACALVPLNNITYPRGLLLYDVPEESVPLRLPLFPDRYKRQMVARTPAFDAAMVQRAEQRGLRWHGDGMLNSRMAGVLQELLDHEYRAPHILSCDTYAHQAMLLNARIWQRLFAPSVPAPDLLYIELESIVGRLLQADLEDRHSLLALVLFNRQRRERLLAALDGARACWRRAELERRLAGQAGSVDGGGTFLFWGVDAKGRRVSLLPGGCRGHRDVLYGRSETGEAWEIALTPEALAQGLQEGILLPSLFCCYLVMALARGVTCVGGYYQAQYLPAMQQGVLSALSGEPLGDAIRQAVAASVTDAYLSGMQAVMLDRGAQGMLPAGPLEIMAHGGLDESALEQVRALGIEDAHRASLLETVLDAAGDKVSGQLAWRSQLARESQSLLGRGVVRLPVT